MTHDPATEAAIAWMKQNEADNIKRAAEIFETYRRRSQDAQPEPTRLPAGPHNIDVQPDGPASALHGLAGTSTMCARPIAANPREGSRLLRFWV